MRKQAMEQMMAVLPNRFRNDQRRLRVHAPKHLHTHLLRINEAVSLAFVELMGPHYCPPLRFQSRFQHAFHLLLLRPTFLVRRQTQVTVGHQINLARLQSGIRFHILLIERHHIGESQRSNYFMVQGGKHDDSTPLQGVGGVSRCYPVMEISAVPTELALPRS